MIQKIPKIRLKKKKGKLRKIKVPKHAKKKKKIKQESLRPKGS